MDNHTINQHLDRLVAAATGRMMLPDHEVFELRQKIRDGVEAKQPAVPVGRPLVEAVTPQIIDWVRCGLGANGRLKDGTHPALEKLIAAYREASHELQARQPEAPQQPAMPEGWRAEVARIRDLIASAPQDALGIGEAVDCPPWPIRDEVVYGLSRLLAATPQPKDTHP